MIAYKTEDEVPQYAVTIRKWNLEAQLPDELFRFEPPEVRGASRSRPSSSRRRARRAAPAPPPAQDEAKQEKKP